MTPQAVPECPKHCETRHARSESDNADQWKAIHALREAIQALREALSSLRELISRRPSWVTTTVISVLLGATGYLYARNDDARGIESRVSVQMVQVEYRLAAVERQLALLTARETR